MKLPWVSRKRYEDVFKCYESMERHLEKAEKLLEAERKLWQESSGQWAVQCERALDSYEKLLDKYHALKLAGASIPEKLEPATPKEPDPVTQAIIAKSKGSVVLRKHYADYVAEQRRMAVSDDEIAEAINRGQDDDQGVP